MTEIQKLQEKLSGEFKNIFGVTSLTARQKDILNKAIEVSRFTNIDNLRSKFGQLLSTVLVGIDECGWDAETLINETTRLIRGRKEQYHSLSRKFNVALLGGAFNPVHNGHIQLAQFVLNVSGEFDEVWLVPCYKHMYNKPMEDPKHRCAMCNIAVKQDARIKVCQFEVDNKFSGETFHALNRLLTSDLAESHNFSIIMGQDNANTFDKWYNYQELEKLIKCVVVGRQGVDVDHEVNWYLKSPHIYLKPDGEIMKGDSTTVRSYLCQGKINELDGLIFPEVLNYIEKHKLYSIKMP